MTRTSVPLQAAVASAGEQPVDHKYFSEFARAVSVLIEWPTRDEAVRVAFPKPTHVVDTNRPSGEVL